MVYLWLDPLYRSSGCSRRVEKGTGASSPSRFRLESVVSLLKLSWRTDVLGRNPHADAHGVVELVRRSERKGIHREFPGLESPVAVQIQIRQFANGVLPDCELNMPYEVERQLLSSLMTILEVKLRYSTTYLTGRAPLKLPSVGDTARLQRAGVAWVGCHRRVPVSPLHPKRPDT